MLFCDYILQDKEKNSENHFLQHRPTEACQNAEIPLSRVRSLDSLGGNGFTPLLKINFLSISMSSRYPDASWRGDEVQQGTFLHLESFSCLTLVQSAFGGGTLNETLEDKKV
ncbi:uncharacterized [Tachysurus ichikawai]